MFLFEIIRVAFGALLAGKVRALLTMLGIIIGTAAVIAVMAMGAGARKAVQDRIAAMADADLTLIAAVGRGGMFYGVNQGFTLDEVRSLRATCPVIQATTVNTWSMDQPVKYRSQVAMLGVVYNVPDYQTQYRLHVEAGRFFTDADDQAHRRVAVLGSEAARSLGGGPNMIGKQIRFGSTDYDVVGVLATRGMVGFTNVDNQVIMPLSSNPTPWSTRVFAVQIKLVPEVDPIAAGGAVERAMRRIRHMAFDEPLAFTVRPANFDTAQLQQDTAATFSRLLLTVAAVSLIVGGIGVMNIMLVSVSERTREIGIRKAIGARRGIILLQFVLEAVVLCASGGAIGVGSGVAAVELLSDRFHWQTLIAPESIILALGFSVAVGLFFGIYPAFRAARLDPVEALRYE